MSFDAKAFERQIRDVAESAVREEGERVLKSAESEINRGVPLGKPEAQARAVIARVTQAHGISLEDSDLARLATGLEAGEPVRFVADVKIDW